jgi:hypothetical protein
MTILTENIQALMAVKRAYSELGDAAAAALVRGHGPPGRGRARFAVDVEMPTSLSTSDFDFPAVGSRTQRSTDLS